MSAPLPKKGRMVCQITLRRFPDQGGWPNGRGISGRMSVERVAESAWNQWPNGRGIRTQGAVGLNSDWITSIGNTCD